MVQPIPRTPPNLKTHSYLRVILLEFAVALCNKVNFLFGVDLLLHFAVSPGGSKVKEFDFNAFTCRTVTKVAYFCLCSTLREPFS